MKFKTKLILVIGLTAIIPLFFAIFVSYLSMQNLLVDAEKNSLRAVADLKFNTIERYFNDLRQDISTTQGYLNVKTNLPIMSKVYMNPKNPQYQQSKNMLDEQLKTLVSSQSGVIDVMLSDQNGKIVYSLKSEHGKIEIGHSLSDPNDLTFTEGEKGIYISDIFQDKANNNFASFFVSAPISDFDNKFAGVIVLEIDARQLYSIIEDTTGLGETGETIIGELKRGCLSGKSKDCIIYLNPLRFDKNAAFRRYVFLGDKTGIPMQNAVLYNNGFGNVLDYRGKEVLAVWRYLPDQKWGLESKMDLDELYRPVNIFVIIMIVFGSISLVLLIMMVRFLSRDISYPIERLTGIADAIRHDNLYTQVDKSLTHRNDEIGILSVVFEKMLIKLRNINEELRQQVSSATKDLQKFKQAADNVYDQIVITDSNGIILYANESLARITGYTTEEVMGKKVALLWKKPMPQKYYEDFWDVIKNKKKTYVGELENRRKNGEIYTATLSVSPILDEKGEVVYFVGLERDITEAKKIDKAKSEFLSLASHQLRTPLSTVSWYCELLLSKDVNKLSGEQIKYIREVYAGSQRMTHLVNALLNISRIEMGTFVVEPEVLDIMQLIQAIIKECTPKINEKKLAIKLEGENIPKVKLDQNLMMIIFQNLITNAVKYSKEQGFVHIKLKTVENDSLSIEVADNGIGIPKNQQENIFKRLFRADNANQVDSEGAGLGLYLTKMVIEHFNGKIWFISEENVGTTFYVTLPLSGLEEIENKKNF